MGFGDSKPSRRKLVKLEEKNQTRLEHVAKAEDVVQIGEVLEATEKEGFWSVFSCCVSLGLVALWILYPRASANTTWWDMAVQGHVLVWFWPMAIAIYLMPRLHVPIMLHFTWWTSSEYTPWWWRVCASLSSAILLHIGYLTAFTMLVAKYKPMAPAFQQVHRLAQTQLSSSTASIGSSAACGHSATSETVYDAFSVDSSSDCRSNMAGSCTGSPTIGRAARWLP